MIAAGLRGAFLLARGHANGLSLIEDTPAGAARSFWAAALCLPGFLALRLFGWGMEGEPPAGLGLALAAELLGYVCAWAGFVLASLSLARAMGRQAAWPHFIAAWNWASVVQYLVWLALTLPIMPGLPPLLAQGVVLASLGYAFWLEWFVAKSALRIAGSQALAFVLLDLAVGIFIGTVVGRVSGE